MTRGYFGIGIEASKTPENVGGLWRSAHAFGAAFMFTVGHRYPDRCQPTDVTKAWRRVPLYEHESSIELVGYTPKGCKLIGVECGAGGSPLPAFKHPERAVYVLGAEDKGLSAATLDMLDDVVEIPTLVCLNVATAGSILLYDRVAKAATR